MRSRAVLPNVERRLTSLARKRAAEAKRRRRRGPGFAIIAFAGLALGGSALAATGVWNPLGGDGDRAAAPSGGVAKVGTGFARGVPILPGDANGGRQRPNPDGGGPQAAAPAFQDVEPVAGPDGEADTGQGTAPKGEGDNGQFGIDGSKPEHPGNPDDGNGPGKDPPSQQGDEQEKPPVENPPTETPRVPSSTRISVFCGLEGEGEIGCIATVSGEAGAPTGQIDFEDSRSGQSANCALSDDGNGISSSCTVDFPVGGPLREVVARYGGDAANASSSTTFLV